MSSEATQPRTGYGSHRDVVRIQALVPEEPVEATVQVMRTWYWLLSVAGWLLAFGWVFHLDQGRPAGSSAWEPVVIVVMVVLWQTPILVTGLLRDRFSPLRLGAWQRGAVAVTPTRVLVVRRTFWRGLPIAVSHELDRSALPASLERGRLGLTALRLRLPDGRVVRLGVPRSRSLAQRTAAPLVIGPPDTRWAADPHEPTMARVWSGSGWTSTTDCLFNIQSVQVVVATD